ncbi:hypothetical protein L593_06935 [Salinarchaeum sp. Harcht-Bsk1]|uniref:DUF371 domain-containing protein n=1 Tax=Salinarchaeum sp. Harcht-Bsk1 TaxID=1333523 RepID=UPI0003424005|nr:DUF371 domain-containing protein [Salinarchaeum sp. Harcht-Bsk1]AGN01334.1 hypothetical protein L593_06935 [Salinarchaeum sp. Harcht-Bsk1]
MSEDTDALASDAEQVRYEEVLRATGHEHVQGTHASTFEVTTDDFLTPAGDCIVGIEADRAPASFDDAFVAACQDPDATIVTELSVAGDEGEDSADGPATQRIVARGDPDLSFENDRSAVWRTSEYVDDRTVAVEADHAAADLDRDLVTALAAGAELEVTIVVEAPA